MPRGWNLTDISKSAMDGLDPTRPSAMRKRSSLWEFPQLNHTLRNIFRQRWNKDLIMTITANFASRQHTLTIAAIQLL